MSSVGEVQGLDFILSCGIIYTLIYNDREALMNKYFFDQAGDERMEKQNLPNWQAIARLIECEAHHSLTKRPWDILDIGCHTGGLLHILNKKFGMRLNGGSMVASLTGVEPIQLVREKAQQRLPYANFYDQIENVPTQSVDLIVGNEFLYLVKDLREWCAQLRRILRPEGGAYIVLGSHGENTAWIRWRERLQEQYDHVSYKYYPMQILNVGDKAGFEMELHRLHSQPISSRRYSPPENGWGEFVSAEEMLNFQNQKYVFVFYPRY